jgi:predicted nucleotidyltransferase
MEAALKQELSLLVELIKKTVDCDKIYLFGSHAYGIPDKDSDLDIFVVYSDEIQLSRIEVGLKIRRNIVDNLDMFNAPIDILTASSSFFNEVSALPTMERVIKSEGMLLYDCRRV